MRKYEPLSRQAVQKHDRTNSSFQQSEPDLPLQSSAERRRVLRTSSIEN